MDWIVVDDDAVDVVDVVDVVDAVVVVVFKICDRVGKISDKIVFGLSNRIVSEEKWRVTLGSELNPELNPELDPALNPELDPELNPELELNPDPVPTLMTSLISERFDQ